MNIREALKEGNKQLKTITEASWLDASLILSFILEREKWYLTAHDDELLSEENAEKYFALIGKRLSGVPVQYITNNQEFMSLNFFVNESVLIPRPDTEILVEEALNYVSTFPKEQRVNILDMCTGSGCIAISIAKFAHNTSMKAVDISHDALDVAKKNADILEVSERIEFVESNLFNNIEKETFDIIVSNPPYIPTKVIESLQIEVRKFEPESALDGGEDGLYFYRQIIKESLTYLKADGMLAFEIGHDQSGQIIRIFDEVKGYNKLRVIKDLAGCDRVICVNRNV